MKTKSANRVPLIATAISLGILVGAALTAGAGWWWMNRGAAGSEGMNSASHQSNAPASQPAEDEILYWTCGMHPSVRAESGDEKCPICFMDLVPVYANEQGSGEGSDVLDRLRVTDQGRVLAGLETVPAEFHRLDLVIDATGRFVMDERRVSHVHSRVGGWVEEVFVEFTGVEIDPGDPILSLYSEELVTAQEEYLLALSNLERLHGSSVERAREGAESLVEAARQRLRRWNLSQAQIDALAARGSPQERLTLHYEPSPDTPDGGVVTDRMVADGHELNPGDRLLTVADLSHLWMMADIYESELAWIEVGQAVELRSAAYPGRVFEGEISFIEPTLNPDSRTVQVRVDVENPDMALRPEMWVDARVMVPLDRTSEVIADLRTAALEQLGGAPATQPTSAPTSRPAHPPYACPMFCEGGTAQVPGESCPVCGMEMIEWDEAVRLWAEPPPLHAYNLSWEDAPPGTVLAIPDLAVLRTGEREVVYTEEETGEYARREVITGPAARAEIGGEMTRVVPVLAGLEPGMRVVTRGNFLLDSQSTLTGGASAAYGSALDTGGEAAMPAGHQH